MRKQGQNSGETQELMRTPVLAAKTGEGLQEGMEWLVKQVK